MIRRNKKDLYDIYNNNGINDTPEYNLLYDILNHYKCVKNTNLQLLFNPTWMYKYK